MTKKDLQSGMIVELFNGDKCLVLDTDKGKILVDDSSYLLLRDYDNNLNFVSTDDYELELRLSIKRIFKINGNTGLNTLFNDDNLCLIWERKYISERKITKDEIRKVFDVKPYENITIID